jgi:hypothetical protein
MTPLPSTPPITPKFNNKTPTHTNNNKPPQNHFPPSSTSPSTSTPNTTTSTTRPAAPSPTPNLNPNPNPKFKSNSPSISNVNTDDNNNNNNRTAQKSLSPSVISRTATTSTTVTMPSSNHTSTSSARSSKVEPLYELTNTTDTSSSSSSSPSVHQRVQSWQSALTNPNDSKQSDKQRTASRHDKQNSLPQGIEFNKEEQRPPSSPPLIPSRSSTTPTSQRESPTNQSKEIFNNNIHNNPNDKQTSGKRSREGESPSLSTKKLPRPVVTPPPKSSTQDTNITNPSSNIAPSSQSRKFPKVIASPKGSGGSGGVSGFITKDNTTK